MDSNDYRRIARENLRGNWGQAILAAFLAALLGGLLTGSSLFSIRVDAEVLAELPGFLRNYILFAASVGSMLALVRFILGGVIRQGYVVYLLKQHDHLDPQLNDIFSQFHRFGDGFCLALLEGLYIFLWSMLFVIPGIVAGYRYAMAPFIMAGNPDMTASEAINASKQMMDGHKGELFILHLTFIGWDILAALSLGIGYIFLNPYMNAAEAAFYVNIGGKTVIE